LSTSPTIHILSDAVANQIAAGEVIERPAAVVKELLENALDAGATRIEIEFRQAGREYIRIEDNGCGMTREDALLSLQRHATSKISITQDLDRLNTFGFRGEALPSIASISYFTLETKSIHSPEGTHVSVDAGKVLQIRDCGRATGTTCEIAHLFHPVPARRKFLKTDATESGHIIQVVRLYALARPDVALSLKEDSKLVFRSAVCSSLRERAGELLGYGSVNSMIELKCADSGMRLEGLVGLPTESKPSRYDMLTFVNGRPVDSRSFNYALIEAYSPFILKGKYPQVILFLYCDPSHVDVNVHPAKREVKFKQDSSVRSFIIRAVIGLLQNWVDSKNPKLKEEVVIPIIGLGEFKSPFSQNYKHEFVLHDKAESYKSSKVEIKSADAKPIQDQSDLNTSPSSTWRFIGAMQVGYLLYDTPSGLIILDYKAAEERIWYELIFKEGFADAVPRQAMIIPLSIELDPISSAFLLDHITVFQSYGFLIAEFGRHFYRIEAIPAWLDAKEAEQFFREIILAIREETWDVTNKKIMHEHFARMAAVRKVAYYLSPTMHDAQTVINQIFATNNPLITPRGKPIFIELNSSELKRRFTT